MSELCGKRGVVGGWVGVLLAETTHEHVRVVWEKGGGGSCWLKLHMNMSELCGKGRIVFLKTDAACKHGCVGRGCQLKLHVNRSQVVEVRCSNLHLNRGISLFH